MRCSDGLKLLLSVLFGLASAYDAGASRAIWWHPNRIFSLSSQC